MTVTAKNNSTVRTFGIWIFIIVIIWFLSGNLTSTFAQQPKIGGTEQRIRGAQDRRRLADTTKFPFSAIVKIIATFPDGTKAEGSGALIGSNKVLTADHVVFNEEYGGDAKSIEILPGYANNYTSCKRTYAKTWKHGSHHGCHDGANCDVAVITTRESLGCNTGWFGYKEFSDSDLGEVFVAGYPADLSDGERMYFVQTTATHLHNYKKHNILSYRDWTYSGMSGGPIFTADYYIIGIHTNGGSDANYGVAFCNQLFSSIWSWKNN